VELGDPQRGGHAGGVGVGEAGRPDVGDPAAQRHGVGRSERVLVGRAEGARHHGVDRHVAGGARRCDHVGDHRDRLVDLHADVAPVVDGRGRDGDGQLVDPGRQRQLGPPQVGDQRGVGDARAAVDPGHHVGGAGHRRDRLGRDEGGHLDRRHPGVGQGVDQGDARRHGHRLLGLETVAGTDVADGDAARQLRQGRHQTGGTPWRRSEKWRSLRSARSSRRTSSSRSASGSMTASTTISDASRTMSTSVS
jgi:hypothetical protein